MQFNFHLLVLICVFWSLSKPAVAAVVTGKQPTAKNRKVAANFDKEVQPLFDRYCYGCHNDEKKKGDLSLKSLKYDSSSHRAIWEKVLNNVRSGEMPPENKPQPTA